MSNFICPVCGEGLAVTAKSLVCKNNHHYDTAKSGYTNLLLSQSVKAKHHGDDRLMVRARQSFLNKGFYEPLLTLICNTVKPYCFTGVRILDAGCGECWYTANIYEYLVGQKVMPEMLGVDISKDALAAGAKRTKQIKLAAASVYRLPVANKSCDMVLSLFAPVSAQEFSRVLRPGGILIRAIPLEKHLWSLKAAVYDRPYKNEADSGEAEGFEIVERREIRQRIHLTCNEDIINLFTMTPYYYKTSAEDQIKLKNMDELDTETAFGLLTYQRVNKQ